MRSLAERASWVAEVSRPVRRRITPRRFKETYINEALAAYHEPTYLEIGVRKGESFRIARAARKIGVDPVTTREMSMLRPGEEHFATTSDGFFADRAPRVLERASVHVALIDGLHEFCQVARDFLNLEPYMRTDGVVFFDDFNPRTRQRGSDSPGGGAWNGDVWKMAALLNKARPDLEFWTVDADEGLAVVTGFGGATPYDLSAVTEECKLLDYTHLERNRTSLLRLIPPSQSNRALATSGAPRTKSQRHNLSGQDG